MNKKEIISVQGTEVTLLSEKSGKNYICITDMARYKNPTEPKDVVKNWMRNRGTIEFLGLWEKIHNPDFKGVNFDPLLFEAGSNSFTMSPTKWVAITNAAGIFTRMGHGGGTYAHQDIAFEFASWISSEFKLYLLLEFQRLKEAEQEALGWSAKRELSKINYHIHTHAIAQHLIPQELTGQQINYIYASEADVLNMAMFGITAKQWRETNPNLQGNMRDYATINELICLSNMENINAVLIDEGLVQSERLVRLNQIAIQQMRVLQGVESRKMLR